MKAPRSSKLLDTSNLKRNHYFLIAGEVMFESTDPNCPPEAANGSVRLNAILTSETQSLNVAQLGKAQQTLQALFFTKAGGQNAPVKVVDVFTLSISHLGRMTSEEFQAQAQPMALLNRPVGAPLV